MIWHRKGSVRVDLVGGTLDIWPINLILPHVVTLNVATSLQVSTIVKKIDFPGVRIISQDYHTTQEILPEEWNESNLYTSKRFGPLTFVLQIMDALKVTNNVEVTLSAPIPPGSGLGTSSALGIVLVQTLLEMKQENWTPQNIVSFVQSIESRILEAGPAGYQDYYPPLLGGILALKASPTGVIVENLNNSELEQFLTDHITLIHSGESRNSGLNNWEMYKGFFDKDEKVRKNFLAIAETSHYCYQAIKQRDYPLALDMIKKEGEHRIELCSSILTPHMKNFWQEIRNYSHSIGLKVCGAGGGGCFILTHPQNLHQGEGKHILEGLLTKYSMKQMPFRIKS